MEPMSLITGLTTGFSLIGRLVGAVKQRRQREAEAQRQKAAEEREAHNTRFGAGLGAPSPFHDTGMGFSTIGTLLSGASLQAPGVEPAPMFQQTEKPTLGQTTPLSPGQLEQPDPTLNIPAPSGQTKIPEAPAFTLNMGGFNAPRRQ